VGTSTSKAAIVAVGNGGNLPNTGASIAIPLLFGLCLVTAGGVVIFSMRTPRKRGRHAA
jgi:LPXTG-motif cell wall-anchored protein